MISPDSYKDTSPEAHDFETERKRSPLFLLISALCALAVTGGLLAGYLYLQRRHAERTRATQQAMTPPEKPPAIPPQAQVYEDEAMLKGAQAVVGGTVRNISKETLSDLSVELELIRRKDGGTERRTLPLEPKDLAPDQQGRYSLSVLKRDYRSAHLVSLKSGATADSKEVAYKSAPGAQRPPERPPKSTETVIVNQPAPRKGSSEEFINSPDNPATIR
ncbi:MAG: hypothetical protein WCF57_15805 [Pyrinomonadaceae bacterium]